MLNDRQTLIKAAAGKPPVTVQRLQRGDDRWWDKSSMPALERGQISRIRQLDWTLLALLQTMEWTSTFARLSHVSLGLWPLATTQLSSGAMREDSWVIVLGPGVFVSICFHFFMISLFKKRTMVSAYQCQKSFIQAQKPRCVLTETAILIKHKTTRPTLPRFPWMFLWYFDRRCRTVFMNHEARLSENLWSLRRKMLWWQSAFIHVFVFPVNSLKHRTRRTPMIFKMFVFEILKWVSYSFYAAFLWTHILFCVQTSLLSLHWTFCGISVWVGDILRWLHQEVCGLYMVYSDLKTRQHCRNAPARQ